MPLRGDDIRERNEKIVLRFIRDSLNTGSSQSEVVQKTGLKAPTVFRIYTRLENLGLIEPVLSKGEASEKIERKGRRPTAYRIKPNALYMIGLDFWAESLTMGVFDLCGEALLSETKALDQSLTAVQVTDLIAEQITAAIRRLKIKREKILGVGVGAPGQVNVITREVSFYSRIKDMTAFPIAAELEALLKLPVTLSNNCAVLALAECRYSLRQPQNSLFMFLLRAGVNGAFIIGDSIFTTARATTIESGHIAIQADGPRCPCGSKGCLEALLTELHDRQTSQRDWLFSGLLPADVPSASAAGTGVPVSIDSARAAAPSRSSVAETPSAKLILDQAASYLAAALRTVARLYNPHTVLFVAESLNLAEAVGQRVHSLNRDYASHFDAEQAAIYAQAYDPVLAQRGAAELVLDVFFNG